MNTILLIILIILLIYMVNKSSRKSRIYSPPASMSVKDIIQLQLNALQTNNKNDNGIKIAYKYASPSNKLATGPYSKFRKMVHNPMYKHLLNNLSWSYIKGSIQKTDKIYQIDIKVKSKFTNQFYIYRFKLSKQYNWKQNKPLYDKYSKMYLNKYWRTDSVKVIEGSTNLNQHPELVNIYDEPLIPCRRRNLNDESGSWLDGGYCSEEGGGVHQICLDVDKTHEFSKSTGQGNWSEGRKGSNHCMCLGAWALYKARQDKGEIKKTNNELHCDSIMDIALSNNYIDTWNTWNGKELNNQIVNGVNHLIDQCYTNATPSRKKVLKQKYLKLTKLRPEFHNTNTYKKLSSI